MNKRTSHNIPDHISRADKSESFSGIPLYKDDIQDILSDEILMEKVFLEAIHSITKHKVPLFAFGQQGEIYKITLPYLQEGGKQKQFVVIKKKKDSADYDLREEFRMQQQISLIKDPYVMVPKVHAFKETAKGDQYIMMDYVDGLTLYGTILKKIVQHNIRRFDIFPPVLDSDADIERAFYKLYQMNGKNHQHVAKTLTSLEKNPLLYSTMDHFKPFSIQQSHDYIRHIKRFLDKMHKQGFYHRDLGANIRNIMFGHDGKVYVIDFGFTKKIDASLTADPYMDFDDKGNPTKAFAHDEEICDIIASYAKD